jgi:hypothetical protein
MSGVKGRSGGARRGSGPRQKRLILSDAAAQKLHIIVLHHRSLNPAVSAESIVAQWIHEHWQELDGFYQQASE